MLAATPRARRPNVEFLHTAPFLFGISVLGIIITRQGPVVRHRLAQHHHHHSTLARLFEPELEPWLERATAA